MAERTRGLQEEEESVPVEKSEFMLGVVSPQFSQTCSDPLTNQVRTSAEIIGGCARWSSL